MFRRLTAGAVLLAALAATGLVAPVSAQVTNSPTANAAGESVNGSQSPAALRSPLLSPTIAIALVRETFSTFASSIAQIFRETRCGLKATA